MIASVEQRGKLRLYQGASGGFTVQIHQTPGNIIDLLLGVLENKLNRQIKFYGTGENSYPFISLYPEKKDSAPSGVPFFFKPVGGAKFVHQMKNVRDLVSKPLIGLANIQLEIKKIGKDPAGSWWLKTKCVDFKFEEKVEEFRPAKAVYAELL